MTCETDVLQKTTQSIKKIFSIIKNYTMKKLVLSSVIMLGVCAIATAQTDSKMNKKPQATSTSPAAPTPQKAAIMPASDAAVAATVSTADDVKAVSPATTVVKTNDASSAVTTVNAAGEVVPVNDAQRREAKMAAVKAANAPVTKPIKQY